MPVGNASRKRSDPGTYEYLPADKAGPQTVAKGVEARRLEFKLHGQKLKGRFALIRTKGPACGQGELAPDQQEG
jgi:hypothetical protein